MCSIALRNWNMEEGMSQHFSWQLSSCTSEMQDQCLATNIFPFNRTLQFAYERFKHLQVDLAQYSWRDYDNSNKLGGLSGPEVWFQLLLPENRKCIVRLVIKCARRNKHAQSLLLYCVDPEPSFSNCYRATGSDSGNNSTVQRIFQTATPAPKTSALKCTPTVLVHYSQNTPSPCTHTHPRQD